MRTSVKSLHFPLVGLDRSRSYRIATEPSEGRIYATPYAVNVRGTDVFGGRYRGGSRPGLKIASVLGAGDVFDKPTTFYRGRKVYADGKLWYASRTGNIDDFDVSGDGEDPSRPVMGKLGFASLNDAEDITAVFAVSNDALFMATRNSLWLFDGDVCPGNMRRVSAYAGVVSKDAWAHDGSVYYFVSSNGLYSYAPGQSVAKVSDNVPEEMNAISTALCAYDPEHNALHIFTDKGDWFFDIGAKAWWPQRFNENHRPVDRGTALVGNVRKAAFLGKDGSWRVFDDKETTDGGEKITSCVTIGPIRTGSREDMDGLLNELTTVLAAKSAMVDVLVHTGKSAEDSVAAAELGVVSWLYTAQAGFNHKTRPRIRGAWVTIVMRSTSAWAFESMTAVTKALGGLR